MLFLQSWWSKTYSRPLKDPLLKEYTLEELYYEYRDSVERESAAEESAEEATDTIEQKKMDEAMSWAEEEEKREAEEAARKETSGPTEEEKAWMASVIEQAKSELGEDFGEDIVEDFSG